MKEVLIYIISYLVIAFSWRGLEWLVVGEVEANLVDTIVAIVMAFLILRLYNNEKTLEIYRQYFVNTEMIISNQEEFINKVMEGKDQSTVLLEMATTRGYGCWYCNKTEGEDLVFSFEFDTPVHKSCVHDALEKNPEDIEARIFMQELECD